MRPFFTSLVLFVVSLSFHGMLQASPISPEQAQAAARQFVNSHRTSHAVAPPLRLTYVAQSAQAMPDYYVFNRGADGGYVVVSGDDRTVPVLGYTDSGSFDLETLPDNLRWWLGEYQSQLQYIRKHPQTALRQPKNLTHGVTPLVTCMWNQGAPFNGMCPTYVKDGETYQAVTGCVATAMAQIMYYHQWPEHGKGSNYYYHAVGGESTQYLGADFDQSYYDWENMRNDYTNDDAPQVSEDAVALLMRDAGYSVNMMYNDGSSGAYSGDVVDALIDHFMYDGDAHIVYRQYYGIDGWETMLRDELDARRPVYYSGSATDGGHAFVIDGYDMQGYFHVNWGWGGMSNGYFVISMLNPGEQGIGSFEGGYNRGQSAIVGIRPPQDTSNPYAFEAFYDQFYVSSMGQTAEFYLHAGLLGNKNWDTHTWGLVVLDETETNVMLGPVLDTDMTDLETWYYYDCYLNLTPSPDLADGVYHIRPVYQCNDLPYKYFSPSPEAPAFIVMDISNGVPQFYTESPSDLQLLSLAPNSTTLYTNNLFEVTATVRNNGQEYYDNVHFALLKNGNEVVSSDLIGLDVANGREETFGAHMTAPSTAGTYQLALFDCNNERLGDPVQVTVEATSDFALELASDLSAASDTMAANHVQASVMIKNTGGTFMGVIEMMILPVDALKINSLLNSQIVTIPAGETREVVFDGSFGGVIGTTYRLWLRNPNLPEAYYLWGNAVYFTVGEYAPIGLAGDVDASGTVDVSDINAIVNIILGKSKPSDYLGKADVTGEGTVDVTDVNAVVNILLGK